MEEQIIKKDTKYWLRWVAVLPGAIIGAILSMFVLHWIFLLKGYQPDPIISSPNFLSSVEHFLTPFFFLFSFIMSGAKIAPTYQFKTALVLTGILILFLIFFFMNLSNLNIEINNFNPIGILGLFLGLYLVKKEEK